MDVEKCKKKLIIWVLSYNIFFELKFVLVKTMSRKLTNVNELNL